MTEQLSRLSAFFATSPAMALLRSPHGAVIVDFLLREFKSSGQIVVPHSQLVAALASYQEGLREHGFDGLIGKPDGYLHEWCSGDKRWLRRLLEADRNEPVYQLTAHTELVLLFLDRALGHEATATGTESRLRLVIDTLDEIVRNATEDPERQLAYLQSEQRRIAEEIERIEREGIIERLHGARLRDRFATALSLLKQLQSDFRSVEERFREITLQVQRRHTAGRDTRGGIVEFALEAEDYLKREDQGVSFHEFAKFILSPQQQERLSEIIQQILHIEDLVAQEDGLEAVRRMVPLLLAEAEKVMRTTQRLSATLRRLLDVRAQQEHRRVAEVLRELRALAARLSDRPTRELPGIEIDQQVEIASPFSRTFWDAPHRLQSIQLIEYAPDEERLRKAFERLARLERLDWQRMEKCVSDAVAHHGSVTLGGLLAEYPPEAGVVEVLGYLQLARDGGHAVSREAVEEIILPARNPRDRSLAVTAPLVRFIGSQHSVP